MGIALAALSQVPSTTVAHAQTTAAAHSTSATSATVASPASAGPGYVTLLFGRTMFSIADNNCNELAGSVPLDKVAQDLSSRGLSATGVVVVDRTQTAGRLCYGGSLYPTWADLDSLRDTYGWSFGSDGMTHNDITTMTPSQQYEESCGSLAYLAENGMTTADAFYAYGDNDRTTAIQTNTVSRCFDYGRTYTGGVNTRATLKAPYYQKTNSFLGGACNDTALSCYKLNVNGKRYGSPVAISSLLQVTSDEWVVAQFYRMVTGVSLNTTPSWDCSSPNWQDHWTSQTEMYCINDFDQAIGTIPAGAVVTSPATVASAWGRQVSSIAGQVTAQSTGKPVAGATVSWSGGSATTDTSGYYTLASVAPGVQSVSVSAPAEPSAMASVSVAAGSTAVQDFSLGIATLGAIAGTVTDSDTRVPISGATVTCTCSPNPATTGAGGGYAFQNITPSTGYSMEFAATDYTSDAVANVTVSAGQTTTENALLTGVPGEISGDVVDEDTDSGVPETTVSCTCATGTTNTDGLGNYAFTDVMPGTYSLTFSATGFATATVNDVVVDPAGDTEEDAALAPGGEIDGVVTDGTDGGGQPIAGATVTCTCASAGTLTDGSGAYTFADVAPGTFTVLVSATGFTSASDPDVVVTAGASTELDVTLMRSTHQVVFSDGFESDNLSAWTATRGFGVEATTVHTGSFAAQANTTTGATYARKTLPATYTTGYGRVWFDIVNQTSTVNVLRFNNAASTQIAYLYVLPVTHLLEMTAGTTFVSTTTVSPGAFHELELSVTVNGAASTTQVWLDGTLIAALSRTVTLPSAPIAQLQIGQVMSGGTYNVVCDDAAFDTAFIP